jgi:hypothetical protein
LEVLNAAILEDVERREAKLNFFEAQLDLLFYPINWLLQCDMEQIPVVRE